MKRFNIFVRSNNTTWTINKMVLVLFILGFIVFQINKIFPNSDYYNQVNNIIMLAFMSTFVGATIYKFARIAKPEKLKGKLEGFLELGTEYIKIGEVEYSIDEIQKIEINNNDFYGKSTGSSSGFDSNLSNGIDNFITLTLNNSQKIKAEFEIYNEFDMGKNEEVLAHYYKLRKLELDQLLKILKLNSKSDIETFKNQLTVAKSTNSR